MAATGLQVNFDDVSFGTAKLKRVTGIQVQENPQALEFMGDMDLYPSVIAQSRVDISLTVTTGDIGAALSLPNGVVNSFTATLKDAKGAEGGDVILVLVGEVGTRSSGGQHGQFGQAQVEIRGRSVDGVTSPLSFTRD